MQRVILVLLAGILLAGVGLVTGSHLITDWMWFRSLGFGQLLVNRLAWEWGLRLAAWLGLTILLLVNLMLVRPTITQVLWRLPQVYQHLKIRQINYIIVGMSVLLGLLYSAGVGRFFWTAARFTFGGAFGAVDPLFGWDIGFFLFRLPFLRLLASALFGALLLTIIVCGAIYFVAGGFRNEGVRFALSPLGKAHLTILGGAGLLVRAFSYYLDSLELVYSPHGAMFGAGFTDVNVRLWALRVSLVLTVLLGVLLIGQMHRWRKLVIGVAGLWLATSIVLGGLVPGAVQRYVVEPNELGRERPYLDHHIAMTRLAYGLDRIRVEDYPGHAVLDWNTVNAHRTTIENARLWDPRPLLQTYSQLQEMRLYYTFVDADVGRYWVDGEYRQVLLSARELAVDQIQNRTWMNEHLQYTHGYGLVMSPVNEVTAQGLPRLWIGDIPPRSEVGIEVTEPRIYYGERTEQYVITNTLTEEFDYPLGDRNAFTRYQGQGGVQIESLFHRLAFALRFGTTRILFSTDITSDSRILFDRTIRRRVEKIAPFLRYDNDPYLMVSEEGRLLWIIDGYTTSEHFPYALPVRGWGNYVRNSVKVVVDAYHGSVDFYQVESDPVLETYSRIFPGWLKPLSDMPEDVRSQLRYPEDLLTLQARVYGTYHMTDTRVFYNREDVWTFAREIYADREQEVVPYYVTIELPEAQGPEMVLMLPLTPARRNNLVAWLAARNDGDAYGELLVYRFPKETLTLGPAQIEARIDQDSEISQRLTLWGQRGSRVIRGNLLVLPIAGGILYVEPLFLQSEQSGMPQLQRVIMAHGDDIVMEPTIDQALVGLFGVEAPHVDETPLEIHPPREPAALIPEELPERAIELYENAQEALRQGDFAAFGQAWEQLENVLRRLIGE